MIAIFQLFIVVLVQGVYSSDLSRPIGCSRITCPPGTKCVQETWECVKAPCPQPGPRCIPIATTRPPCLTCPPGQQCYSGGFGPPELQKDCPMCVPSKPKDETCADIKCACDEHCEIVGLCVDAICYGYCYDTAHCVKNEGAKPGGK